MKETRQVEEARIVCEHRFRPIYEPAVLPLAVLASCGLDYRDVYLKGVLMDLDVGREMRYWSTKVFICELINMLRLVKGIRVPTFCF